MSAIRRVADRFRNYGKKIQCLRSPDICNAIQPHHFLLKFNGNIPIPSSFRALNSISFGGFGGSYRGFSDISITPTTTSQNEEESDGDYGDDDYGDGKACKYDSPNKTPMVKICFNPHEWNLSATLDKWVEQGNVIIKEECEVTMKQLCKHKFYRAALQVSTWLWSKKPFEFDESYYATTLHCILNSESDFSAQRYFEKIPSDMRRPKVYRVLLSFYAVKKDVRRTEFFFGKLRELGSELHVGDFNNMLLAYCFYERKHIPKLLQLMQASNVRPNVNTYRNLLYEKGLLNDAQGMTELVERMKADGLEPNVYILSLLAKQYIKSAMFEKADEILSKLENLSDLEKNAPRKRRSIIRKLLWHYALLNRENDLERHWKEIESDLCIPVIDSMAGILAWGKLGKVDKAENIFDNLLKSGQKVREPHYNTLLQVYAENRLRSKAEDLLEQMLKVGIQMNKRIRGTLVRLYVNLGDLEKAETVLSDDVGDRRYKPEYPSLILLLKEFSERGDINNAERIFNSIKKAGYDCRLGVYTTLLQAYIKAKVPAPGFKERVIQDNSFLNKDFLNLLEQANGLLKITTPEKIL